MPVKKLVPALALALACLPAIASHLVGGEFRMHYVSGFRYRIDLIQYIDLVNANPASRDVFVVVGIFRNSDNTAVRTLELPFVDEVTLAPTTPACQTGPLSTAMRTYSSTVTLEPDVFTDTGGYYLVWERCCRNYQTTNIYSADPSGGSIAAGLTVYLSFPPVVKDGGTFVNSSPQLSEPRADYGCVGKPFFADFSAVDNDGDSLAYSLVTPYSTQTFDAIPPIAPKPYPFVIWRPGFSATDMMDGNPDVAISSAGTVTVTPSLQGVFVYAVSCKEYRNGSMIGEVRREYQVLVMDCPLSSPPAIVSKAAGGTFSDAALDVHFDSTATNSERCVSVQVSDPDALNHAEDIRIGISPIGFSGNVSGYLPSVSAATLTPSGTTAEFAICFDRCPPVDGPFSIAIIAYDASCGVPLTDTVRVNVVLDVTPGWCLQQSIDFPPVGDRTIGDAPFQLNAEASSGLPVSYTADNANAVISATEVTLMSAGLVTITASQPGNDRFRAAPSVPQGFCINPLPPVLTMTTELDGAFVTLHSSISAGNTWYRNGVAISQMDGDTFMPGDSLSVNDSIYYSARVVVGGCFSEMSNVLLATRTGEVTGLVDALSVPELFPNPVTDYVEIRLPEGGESSTIEVYDVMGRKLSGYQASGREQSIAMGDWGPGLYVVRVRGQGGIWVGRVVKK